MYLDSHFLLLLVLTTYDLSCYYFSTCTLPTRPREMCCMPNLIESCGCLTVLRGQVGLGHNVDSSFSWKYALAMRYREGTDKDCHGSRRFRTFTLDRAVEREKDVVGHVSLAADVTTASERFQ
jgi:hypothetical protein